MKKDTCYSISLNTETYLSWRFHSFRVFDWLGFAALVVGPIRRTGAGP